MPLLALDGIYTQNYSGAPTNYSQIYMTTTQPNDVLVCFVIRDSGAVTISIPDTAHVTGWQQRASVPISGGRAIEEWWALAPVPLTSEGIAVMFSPNVGTFVACMFAVVNTTYPTPFDPGMLVPTTKNTAPSDPLNFSTLDTFTLAFAAFYMNSIPNSVSGAGWTRLISVQQLLIEYQFLLAPAISLPASIGAVGLHDSVGAIVDAVSQFGDPPILSAAIGKRILSY